MQKVAVLVVVALVLSLGLVAPMEAGQVSTLKPGVSSSDVKVLKKPHPMKVSTTGLSNNVLREPTGIIDTLRAYTGIGGVNFGFENGDSMLIWLKPQAACSLIAIRLYNLNWIGNMLLDIWDGSRYAGHINTQDSTDANGFIGTFVPMGSADWVPGYVMGHSPLGWNSADDAHHPWGPFPFTVTQAHADSWFEIPASAALQGEVNLGDDPFYVGAVFFKTDGWGFLCDDPDYTPYGFFKFYQQCCGPDGTHDGWFIRSFSPWVEVVVSYYENTPPNISGITRQNDTYGAGPFLISAEITDVDAENTANAGIAGAYLVYTINTSTDSVPMNVPFSGDVFTASVPAIELGDQVTYYISACDLPGLCSKSPVSSFRRSQPVHQTADLLLINDGMQIDSLYLDMLDDMVFDDHNRHYEYEYWDIEAHNGIDASVVNWGWKTIIVAGWGCRNTLPGFEYDPDGMFASFLESGVSQAESRNLLYIDQDYFCVQDDYGCEWDEELREDDFVYDYFGVAFAISDNHGADDGGYDSVAVGIDGDPISGDFAGQPINFRPDVLTDTPASWNWPDWIESEVLGAHRLFTYRDSQFGAGVRFDSGHFKTVYLPWQLDFAVDTTETGDVIPRPGVSLLLQNILWWFETKSGVTLSDGSQPLPEIFDIGQNYPNPFNAGTDIRYRIADDRLPVPTSLTIHNILGQQVRILVREDQNPGQYVVTWDGKDENGSNVGSGIYFYRLSLGEKGTQTRKMVLLR